jgi:hypothetical protein
MMATSSGKLLDERYEVPDEERVAIARKRESYDELIQRLSHQSVV